MIAKTLLPRRVVNPSGSWRGVETRSREGSCACPAWAGWAMVPDMRASEIRQLIRMKPVELDTTRRRLGACHDIGDLRAMGRKLTPRPVFDYVDDGHHHDRGPGRRCVLPVNQPRPTSRPARPVVPAVHPARQRDEQGPG